MKLIIKISAMKNGGWDGESVEMIIDETNADGARSFAEHFNLGTQAHYAITRYKKKLTEQKNKEMEE